MKVLFQSSGVQVCWEEIKEDDSVWFDVWVDGKDGKAPLYGYTHTLPTITECYGHVGDYLNG